jgi:ribosomal protein L22
MSEEQKPRRSRRKKDDAPEVEAPLVDAAEESAVDSPQSAEAAADAAESAVDSPQSAEPEPERPEAEGEEPDEEKPKRGRRRSAETAAAAKREPVHKKAPAPRAADGTVVVRAQAKYVRHAPRKARLVVDHIRGKSIGEARAILQHTPRAAAVDVLKLLESAVANAENNHELVADDLVVRKAYVDEGPTLKRYRPRALGRATRIRKRTSHMTIQLSPKE